MEKVMFAESRFKLITSQNLDQSEDAYCPQEGEHPGAPTTWPLCTSEEGLLHPTCLAMNQCLSMDPGLTSSENPASHTPTYRLPHAYSVLECIFRVPWCVLACWKWIEVLEDSHQRAEKNSTSILCNPIPKPNLFSTGLFYKCKFDHILLLF